MPKEYIEREELLNNLKRFAPEHLTQLIVDLVQKQPAADLAEVRHGKNITKMYPTEEFICSECGLIMRDFEEIRVDEENDECHYEFEFKYCPHCGAKMDEKDGE